MNPLKQTFWQKVSEKTHAFLRDKKGLKLYFTALALIILTGGAVLAIMQPVGSNFSNAALFGPKPPAPKFYSPLTGIEVKDEAATKQQVTAIMIENSPDARPQSGLKDSGVVYEAIAEGGITRFAVLYQEQKPGLIGPVRSLRPYYVDWIASFDASIVHVGGSANALAEVRNGTYKDSDQFFNGEYFWRSSDRYAPHNVYTNSEKMDAMNSSKGYNSSSFTGFPRTDIKKKKPAAKKPTLPAANNIDVNISYGQFNVRYEYLANEKRYKRFQGGEPHMDRESGQIEPTVAVVIKVPTSIGFEDGYREQMQTVGEGEAFIFQNGTVLEGKWRKTDRKHQLEFLTKENEAVQLERGQTWITAIPTERSVTWQ